MHYEWPMIRHEQQTRKLQANLNSITLRSLNIRVNNGLKIITWNINSLRKRYPLLTALIAHEQPDILLLQETKVIDAEFDKLAPIPNYNVYRTGCIRFNGVAIYTRINPTSILLTLPNCDVSNYRCILINIQNLVIINVYIHQGQRIGSTAYNNKLQYLASLVAHITMLQQQNYIVIVAGDLNIMPNDTDLYNASHPEWSIYAMISLNERKAYQRLLDVGLVDIMSTYLPPHTYTRWENFNTERDKHCGYRLDHFLVSFEYVQHVQTISVLTHWRSMPSPSDHAPVSMVFNPTH